MHRFEQQLLIEQGVLLTGRNYQRKTQQHVVAAALRLLHRPQLDHDVVGRALRTNFDRVYVDPLKRTAKQARGRYRAPTAER